MLLYKPPSGEGTLAPLRLPTLCREARWSGEPWAGAGAFAGPWRAAMGEGGEGQQSDLLIISSSSSDEPVWVHREHHAPIKKQQRFRASARQGGSRARKYTQGDLQEQQKAGEQGSSTAEQDSEKATNDESGRRDAGTHAIHLRHGQHPSMND